jgi:uncharacterized protein YrrD
MARATELIGLPVVTFAGEDIAEIKDVVYEPTHGGLVGFTLNKRGFFRGRLKLVLTMDAVHSLGRDAVMVETEDALADTNDAPGAIADASSERNVIGAAVITDGGKQLGTVTDVVVSLGRGAEAVGYELGGSAVTAERGGRPLYIPLPEQLAVSGEALMVPGEVEVFVHDDLSGFGAAVADFRAQLHRESRVNPAGAAPAPATATPTAPSEMSRPELIEEARRRNLEGYASMTRAELLAALS